MGKNKKKSVSKVIISKPLSNGSDNDEDVKLEELHKLPSSITLPEEDLTTLVNIKIELEPEIIQLVEQTLEQTHEQTLEQTQEQMVEQTQEQMVEQKQEQAPELTKEQELKKENNSENIELTEIQISNVETTSSPQKKPTGCSRGWCSIL